MFSQIVINHTTRTALIGPTYTTHASARRGVERVVKRQGPGDTLNTRVFDVSQREGYLDLANQYTDTLVFADPS